MRILVVDDEPRISADISAALTAAGYLADIATDGEHAWFRGDTEAYDLVILDLGLPKMDGLSVLRRWREAERHMPVLILTARGAWPERVEGIGRALDDHGDRARRTRDLECDFFREARAVDRHVERHLAWWLELCGITAAEPQK